jgi:hypothetical protein
MPAYVSVLPEVFPYVMAIPVGSVPMVTEILSASRPGVPHGSSFAITSELHDPDMRKLWMSETSYTTMKDNHAVIIHREKPMPNAPLANMRRHYFEPSQYDNLLCAECGNTEGYTGHKR